MTEGDPIALARIDQLVAEKRLEAVEVRVPPPCIPTAADPERELLYGKLCAWTCEPNSRCIVDMMHAGGEPAWAIVAGYAYFHDVQLGQVRALPRAHVWVTNGRDHFDATWSRMPASVAVDRCRYFAVTAPLRSSGILTELRRVATEWDLDIADHHPRDEVDADNL